MREKLLTRIADISARKPGLFLLITLVITVIAIFFAKDLQLSMQFKDLMPQNHPLIKGYNDIIDDYDSASVIILAATGKEDDLKKFADTIAPKLEALDQYVSRVDYKLNTEFLLNHGLMLQKEKDLKNSKDIYSDINLIPWLSNLNDTFEKTYIDDDESISTKQKENNAMMMLDGIDNWTATLTRFANGNITDIDSETDQAAREFLIGDQYMLSPQKDMIIMLIQPKFTIDNVDTVVAAVDKIDDIIAEVQVKYPGLDAGTTGTMSLARDEMVSAKKDMNFTTIIALFLILGLFIFSFRMWSAPILAGFTMIIGVIWTAGFAGAFVGSLNMMTSMFGVIILGLGIDFSIHIISIYTELRADGYSISEALKETFLKSGGGIITGALTTGFAFYTLMISKSVGMYQFGLIAGSGVILCMITTLIVLPSLLVVRDRMGKATKKQVSTKFHFLGGYSQALAKRPYITITVIIILSAILLYSASKITFDYNYLNMEPKGLESIKLQHMLEDKFDMTPDYALIATSSIEESEKVADEARKMKMIGYVTAISDYVPSLQKQKNRAKIITEIQSKLNNNNSIRPIRPGDKDQLVEQLGRLQDNIIELAQLAYMGGQDKLDKKSQSLIGVYNDPENNGSLGKLLSVLDEKHDVLSGINQFQQGFYTAFKKYSQQMSTEDIITLDMLPIDIKDQFISRSGDKYLVSMYPKESVWNLAFLERFKNQMAKLDPKITGMPLVFYTLIDIVGKDGKNAAIFSLIIIFLLLMLDLRSIKLALLAMVPLILGAIWMIGVMYLTGLQLTLLNVMGLPLILGIGVDDGVHILHRYSSEKRGSIRKVFTSTGRAVLITSLTTMLAFGSLKFATYRGLGSLGIALFIGVGTCFIVTVSLLPAVLELIDRRHLKK
ncbi:MAG: MMPL family transporter [Candidatus Cloacimonetes bacterium]|nr:MMPL family transporter [Candidatus Cloacimonadota bacterium]